MFLTRCTDLTELAQFLKIDYANNLYFFTYLSEILNSPDINILIARRNGKVELSLLLAPIHCCISTSNIEFIDAVAKQLPPINSIHVVGRKDYVEKLLQISEGADRDKHIYSFCEFIPADIPAEKIMLSFKASKSKLKDLIEFYNDNDMLVNAESRLPGILSWGEAYCIQRDGKIVACALTTTETNDAAMIGAVYTTPEYRNNGYAKDCIFNLGRELVLQHKKPYLFYQANDVLLSRLYESMGFKQINTWMLASRK